MMDPNFTCSVCPQTASCYCMCLSEKVYFCEQCLSCHIILRGVHVISPVSVQITTLKDLKDYNHKQRLAHKLSDSLDKLTCKLTMEYAELSEALNQRYTAQAYELHSVYAQAKSDIDTLYQGIRSAIEASKQEITLWGQKGLEAFSDDTVTFFEAAHPLENPSLRFVNIEAEMTKRLTFISHKTELPKQNYLKNVLASWGLQKCECLDCNMLRHVVGQKEELEAIPARMRSESQNYHQEGTCRNCGQDPFVFDHGQSAPISSSPRSQSFTLPLSPSNPYWTCTCGYEYNLTATCQKCNGDQSLIMPKPEICAQLSPPSPLDCWTCSICKYEFNRNAELTCRRSTCGRSREIQIVTWYCPNCFKENAQTAQTCIKCKVKRGWANYLEYQGLELNPDKTQWKCSKCQEFVNVSVAKCSSCGYIPKAIEKGIQGEGYKTTFWGRLRSLITR